MFAVTRDIAIVTIMVSDLNRHIILRERKAIIAWWKVSESASQHKEVTVAITSSISISSRHYLSISHLSAAALFSQRAATLEPVLTLGDSASNEGLREHKACVVTSIMLSVAFLEAVVNELWADCSEGFDPVRIEGLQNREVMATLWRKSPLKRSTTMLEKFELALELNAKPALSRDASPYQDVKLLVDLRNALVHYEPETISSFSEDDENRGTEHKFEKKLRGRFEPNRLTGPGNPFYPDKVLGAGCARWAIASAVAFADSFFEKLGIPSMHGNVRSAYGV
ncbi:hypothetical protein [Pseudomonas alvandae]|uniref:hypothetical protein n=1 Tax=Pseudomonas canavaninivorans TaxID=2842348 RepID=UPI002B1D44F2|nr:hypothetical protein [Pseudomonas canavaninivorans]